MGGIRGVKRHTQWPALSGARACFRRSSAAGCPARRRSRHRAPVPQAVRRNEDPLPAAHRVSQREPRGSSAFRQFTGDTCYRHMDEDAVEANPPSPGSRRARLALTPEAKIRRNDEYGEVRCSTTRCAVGSTSSSQHQTWHGLMCLRQHVDRRRRVSPQLRGGS